jgi:glutamate-1-semialdehyde 2,1-aminomutase
LAPLGPVTHSSPSSGNALDLARGIAVAREALKASFYSDLALKAEELAKGISKILAKAQVPAQVVHAGALWGMHFAGLPVENLAGAKAADKRLFARLFHGLLQEGVFLPPDPLQAAAISQAHGKSEIAFALKGFQKAVRNKNGA